MDHSIYTFNEILTAIAERSMTITHTQYKILGHLKQGLTHKEIAHAVNLTPDTVEKSIKALKKKFGCKNAVELMYYVIKNEIIL